MNSSLIVSCLALLVSGVTLLMLVVNEPGSRGSRGPEVAAAISGPVVSEVDLARQLAELSGQNQELRSRIRELELRPTTESRAPITGEFVRREELEELLSQWPAGRRLSSGDAGDRSLPTEQELAEFELHVGKTLEEIRKRESVRKLRLQQEEREARLDDVLAALEGKLGLTEYQSKKLRSVLLARYEREADILRRFEVGEDPEVLDVMKANDRDVHLREVAEVLDSEQFAGYTAHMGLRTSD